VFNNTAGVTVVDEVGVAVTEVVDWKLPVPVSGVEK